MANLLRLLLGFLFSLTMVWYITFSLCFETITKQRSSLLCFINSAVLVQKPVQNLHQKIIQDQREHTSSISIAITTSIPSFCSLFSYFSPFSFLPFSAFIMMLINNELKSKVKGWETISVINDERQHQQQQQQSREKQIKPSSVKLQTEKQKSN